MQAIGRARTPPLSHYTQTNHTHHSYTSSSESSYGRLQSHSRSESGTSQTNYDDPLATPPPPRTLMEEYVRSPPSVDASRPKSMDDSSRDPMTMHLLLEDAVDDSELFEILSPEELKALKKEQNFLSRRIESAKKRLYMETRLHKTAQSLQRLDSRSTSKFNPQSSLGKRRSSGGSEMVDRTSSGTSSDTLVDARKCEELAQNVWKLERRQAELRERHLRHTAGVLKLNYQSQTPNASNDRSIDPDDVDDEDEQDEPKSNLMENYLHRGRDAPENLKPRLEALGADLYDLISRSGPYSKAGYSEPPGPSAETDDELAYVEMGLSTIKGLYEGLAKYSEQSVEKVRRYEQMNAVVTGLWDIVGEGERELKETTKANRNAPGQERALDDDDSSDDESIQDEEFSIQAFSSKVQRLCERAGTLAEQHQEMHQERALVSEQRDLGEQLRSEREARQAAEASLLLQDESKAEEIESLRSQAAEHEAASARLQEQAQEFDNEREELEAEIVRLQTEVTVARAELDGAYGTRAQRALEGQGNPDSQKEFEELISKNTGLLQEKAEIEERVDVLQRELRELVTEYEGLVKQGVEAEKEREALEGVVDSLKEKVEEAEAKLSDEKVKSMGKRNSKQANGEPVRAVEATSTGVMRNEFKKMMRDARAEHFRSLRAEQEERRRLEAVIRSLRKEQSTGNASAQSASAQNKSGLGKAVAVSS